MLLPALRFAALLASVEPRLPGTPRFTALYPEALRDAAPPATAEGAAAGHVAGAAHPTR